MKLLYFGGDLPWKELLDCGFRRRNTWLLKCFHDGNYFDEILIFKEATRTKVFKEIFSSNKEKGIRDLYFANMIPLSLKGRFFRKVNTMLSFFFFWLQGGRSLNNRDNIVWCYWPKGLKQAMNMSIRGRYFFDTDHNIIKDVNLDEHRKVEQQKILIEAGKISENVISSVRSMLKWYQDRGFDNIYRMRNGIDLDRFQNITAVKQDVSRPIIGYIGTISKWVNYQALEFLLKKHPEWNILIYGATFRNDISDDLIAYDNCHFMGPLLPENVPETIKSFDVALNIYRKEPWLDVDSMKIYEYLAAGVPVVSINFHDYLKEDFDDLLFLVKDENEMEQCISDILEGKIKNKDTKGFLQNNTWQERVKKFYDDVIRK